MKTAKIINLILIVSFLNLDLIFKETKSSEGPDTCSCPISRAKCDLSNSCCCRTKDSSSWQINRGESRSHSRRDKTEAYICELSCGSNQTRILPLPTVKIYILTDHPALVFNQIFSFHKTLPCYMPEKIFKNPPYKPPQKLIQQTKHFYFI
jgi:hypothetical protein